MAHVSRRDMIGASAGILAGAGLVAAAVAAGHQDREASQTNETPTQQQYSPYGAHQVGIDTPTQAAGELLAFTLRDGMDADALARLMRVWTSDIAALMEGRPALGDTLRDLAQEAVSMSVLVGLGPGVFELDGLQQHQPAGFQEIPPMVHDELDPAFCGGDLLLWIGADDFTSVAYAKRRLTHDAEPFASLRWTQQGSWRGIDAEGRPTTGRNLFGQVDGTANPAGEQLDEHVWSSDGWLSGGTQLVVRRIEMDLPEWDKLTRPDMEKTLGRDLDTGAPLTGGEEHDDMDFDAVDQAGNPVVPLNAHARLSHPDSNGGRTILRRVLNYSDHTGTGLIFGSFQANIAEQFIPIQRTLDDADALNEWTTAVGSAVFVIPPGLNEAGYFADAIFQA